MSKSTTCIGLAAIIMKWEIELIRLDTCWISCLIKVDSVWGLCDFRLPILPIKREVAHLSQVDLCLCASSWQTFEIIVATSVHLEGSTCGHFCIKVSQQYIDHWQCQAIICECFSSNGKSWCSCVRSAAIEFSVSSLLSEPASDCPKVTRVMSLPCESIASETCATCSGQLDSDIDIKGGSRCSGTEDFRSHSVSVCSSSEACRYVWNWVHNEVLFTRWSCLDGEQVLC